MGLERRDAAQGGAQVFALDLEHSVGVQHELPSAAPEARLEVPGARTAKGVGSVDSCAPPFLSATPSAAGSAGFDPLELEAGGRHDVAQGVLAIGGAWNPVPPRHPRRRVVRELGGG